jgi:hypothetical protein
MAADMEKATYDTNNNGVVDTAEAVAWAGVTGKPATESDQFIIAAQVFG